MTNIRYYNDGTREVVEVLIQSKTSRFTSDLFAVEGNVLKVWEDSDNVILIIPDWLADGIRELVKNKVENG